jgi:hypothetical protein
MKGWGSPDTDRRLPTTWNLEQDPRRIQTTHYLVSEASNAQNNTFSLSYDTLHVCLTPTKLHFLTSHCQTSLVPHPRHV